MRGTASKVKSFQRQGVTVLILLLLFGAYYAFIVPSQQRYFTQRDFRLLGAWSDQIRDVVVNQGTGLINACKPPRPARFADAGAGPYQRALQAAEQDRTAPTRPNRRQIEAALSLVPTLSLIEPPATNVPSTAAAGPRLSCEVVPAAQATSLDFTYETGPDFNLRLKARADLRQLIEPIVSRREFDDVLLLNANGEVLFQRVASELRVARLDLATGKSFQTNLTSYTGTTYKLFAQPVAVALAAPGAGGPPQLLQWTLCGVVRADRFRSETMTVNYTVVLVFLSLASLLVLSWPFLNVWSLGLRGGLRPAEVILLACSTLAMSAFLTLMVLDFYAYEQTEERLDGSLKRFAGNIKAHFRAELRQVAGQMELLNARFLLPGHAGNQTGILARPDLVRVGGPDADPYPYFTMAVWIDRRGDQLAKWTVKDETTPLVNVASREYFRGIVGGRSWVLTLATNRQVHFILEPIYSVNTGENLVAFAMAPGNDRGLVSTLDLRPLSLFNPVLPAGYGFCVVDVTGKVLFHSDERRNLRENFFEECNQEPRLRAAVLGRTADRFDCQYARRVHSLYVTPIPELPWSLVTFRDEQLLSTALVEMASSAVMIFLLFGVLLAAGFGALYLLLPRKCVLWLWPSENYAGTYALLALLNLGFALILTAVILFSRSPATTLLAGGTVPILALFVSFVGLTVCGRKVLHLEGLARLVGLRLRHQWGYVAAMGLLLILLAVLPITALFKVTFDNELRLAVKATQLQLAQDFESRAGRLWHEVNGRPDAARSAARPLAVPDPTAFFEASWKNTWDIYTACFFDTTGSTVDPAAAPPRPAAPSGAWLAALPGLFRPHYNDWDLATRSVMADAASDGSWWWTRDKDRLVLSRAEASLPPHGAGLCLLVSTALPGLPPMTWLWAAALIVVVGATFFIVYVVADRVLLLNVKAAATSSSLLLDSTPDKPRKPHGPGKYLLLGPPRSGKTGHLSEEHFTRLRAGAFQRFDLREAGDRDRLRPDPFEALLRDPDMAIVIDHFEYNLEDGGFNRDKLRLLQQFRFDEARTVILVSSVHPLHFNVEVPPPPGAKPDVATASDLPAWIEALEPYRKLYCLGRPGLESTPTSEGHTSQQARALYRSLWQTCSPAEQETLHEVAHHRLVRSDQREVLALLDRGLLQRKPHLRLMDEAFQRFAVTHFRPEAAAREVAPEAASPWQSLKGPAVTVLILLASFFFTTQQELWNQTIALVTAFVTGIGALAKGYELFQRTRIKKAAESGD